MGQKKLHRFEAIKSFPNVLQYPEGVAGSWNRFFKNDFPITLELACGKGEYAVGLARMHPTRNFIGVDLKGNRLYVGAKESLRDNLQNVAFMRTQIGKINEYFEKSEVEEIWITFPDPQLRTSKAKKRLTHPVFLRLFQQFLKPGGSIHLKTDSPDLYEFTRLVISLYGLTILEDQDDIYSNPALGEELKIRTYYEGLDIANSRKIHYLRFSLPSNPLSDNDERLHEIIKGSDTKIS